MRNTSVFCLCNKNGGPSRYKGGFYMASYTQHYQLHQWEPSDDFLRSDFNDDFKKIDTAIKSTEQSLQTKFDGEVARLDQDLSDVQQALQTDFDGEISRLDKALSDMEKSLRADFDQDIDKLNASLGTLQSDKAELIVGNYAGDHTNNRLIQLGVTPRAVIIKNPLSSTTYGHTEELFYLPVIATRETPSSIFSIVEGGFRLSDHGMVNNRAFNYLYLAFC